MRYFLDTEFMEKPCTIGLISIGIVAEDGREFYAVSSEFNPNDANDWVKENVLKPIAASGIIGKPLATIRQEVLDFIGGDKRPEFWGYYADYDWVVFCWLFGRMIDLPKGWPMYCRDLKQWSDQLKAAKLPDPIGEHNAIVDARWNRDLYDHCNRISAALRQTRLAL
jgi:hypothetical protein